MLRLMLYNKEIEFEESGRRNDHIFLEDRWDTASHLFLFERITNIPIGD